MKPLMLDLCAGLGGQSEAYLQAGWDILRVDNNPLLSEVPRMIIADIDYLEPHPSDEYQIEYVHASPSCYWFSRGHSSPRSIAEREGQSQEYDESEDVQAAIDHVLRCKEIIDILKPRYWSIENVRVSMKYLVPFLGEPRLIINQSYCYWGNFPMFDPSSLEIPSKHSHDKRHSPIRANYLAKIPFVISSAFLTAMTNQTRLDDY